MNAKLYPARAIHSDSYPHASANGYSGTTDTAMNVEGLELSVIARLMQRATVPFGCRLATAA